MVIRIFMALFVLNLVAFVVRADADEWTPGHAGTGMSAAEEISQVEAQVSGQREPDHSEAVSGIGLRLLSLTLNRSRRADRHYASDPALPDHGIALLDEGACLNLKWNF